MSSRRHLLRPRLSAATRARPNLAALDAKIAAAKAKHDTAEVARLENEKAWALVNSLVP
jgi:hypothetical protein